MHFSSYYFNRFSNSQRSPTLQNFPNDGLDYLIQSFIKKGLSKIVISRLIKNIEKESIKKYNAYWSKFSNWCQQREVNPSNLSVDLFSKFLIHMYDTGLSASTLSFIRSSISFFIKESHLRNIVEDEDISRLLKSFEKSRRTFPRYSDTWDVNKVLTFLSSWSPHKNQTFL